MTFLLLRRLAILLTLVTIFGWGAVQTIASVGRGVQARTLAAETRAATAPLQQRFEALEVRAERSHADLAARAMRARDVAAAFSILEGGVRAAFGDGEVLSLVRQPERTSQVVARLHWRGDEDQFRRALLDLQANLPNLSVNLSSLRVVSANHVGLLELEVELVHVWMVP